MIVAIVDDTLVAIFDFFKFFFFFRYLLCYDISLKKGRILGFSFFYLCTMIAIHDIGRLGYYAPLFSFPFICILLFSHGIACRPKTLFIALLTDILIGQFDGFIGSVLQLAPPLMEEPAYISILTSLISLPLFYVICRLCASHHIQIGQRDQGLFIATQTVFLFLDFTLTGTAGNILEVSDDPFYGSVLHFAISAMALVLDVCGLLLFFLIQSVRRYREIQKLQDQLLQSQSAYVAQILQQDRELRRFRHDIRGHMTCLEHFLSKGQSDAAQNYMRQIHDCLDASARVAYDTKNPVADALLNGRLAELSAQDITLTVKGFLPQDPGISDFDLCVLLVNLISNAQEACLRLPEGQSRWITLEFDPREACLCIRMQNPIQEANHSLRTTKADRANHGIGLDNIRRCVERYHGDLDISQENGVFQTEIFFFTSSKMDEKSGAMAQNTVSPT